MTEEVFDYEKVCMAVRDRKPKSYFIPFNEDYRLNSLFQVIPQDKIKILDIGCGGGVITDSLPHYFPNATIKACDISSSAIANAKKFGSGKVDYSVISKGHLPYKDGAFDFAFCIDVLEHVPNVTNFLNEARRVLKKGGQFFVLVPCEAEKFTYPWFFNRIHIGNKLTYKYFGHIHPEFTHAYVEQLLRKHKFRIVRKFYSEHFFYQVLLLIIYFLPKILLEQMLGERKALEYSDSFVANSTEKNFDAILLLRKSWFKFMRMARYPMYWETLALTQLPLGALKLNLLLTRD